MKKISLIIENRDNTEDEFEFNSLDNLFEFINQLTVEKLMDSNSVEMVYNILVLEE